MSAILLPNKFRQQPQHHAPVDRFNPLGAKVIGGCLPGVTSLLDAGRSNCITRGITSFGVGSKGGSGNYATATKATILQGRSSGKPSSSRAHTLVFVFSGTGHDGYLYDINSDGGGGDPLIRIVGGYLSASFGSLGTLFGSGDAPIPTSGNVVLIFHWGDYLGENATAWVNGTRYVGRTYTDSWTDSPRYSVFFGSSAYPTINVFSSTSVGHLAAILRGNLTDIEAKRLTENPWQIFKAPSRRLWAASAGGTTHDLIGVGQISSAEAFGTSALSAGVTSSGAATSEALGSPGVTAEISATGIATVEAIGSAAIVAGVAAAGIETVEAEGSTQLAAGIAGSAIASTEALGDATLTATIQAAGITSIETVGAPEVGGVAPANVVGAGVIASAEASGSPAVSATVEGSGVSSAEGLGQPAVGIPAASVTGVGQIATAEAFGSPAAALAVAAAGIDSAETTGSVAVVVAIDGAGNIATTEVVGVPIVGEVSPQEIIGAGGIASAEAFGNANIHPLVPYTGTGFQQGSGHRPLRRQHRQPVQVNIPHSIGAVGIESAERLGYPTLTWRGRTRRIREEEFLLGRAA